MLCCRGGYMRTIEVQDLGWDAALVTIADERVLLIDAALSWDKRMDVMSEALVVSG